jgi:peptidoglycan/xylan/chitin deacetylase (PgdA/CDA1 family)
MYHSITDAPESGVGDYYKVNTSPAVFRQHMQYLKDHGYRTISLDQLVAWLRQPTTDHRPLTTDYRSPVVLTFDDGLQNFFTEAFPTMQEHGFTATVFLSTGFIGDTPQPFRPAGHVRSPSSVLRPPFSDCLAWTEVRELHKAGIEFGSHTVSHPKLVDLSWKLIESELRDSRSQLEYRLESPVAHFCYPYAFPQANKGFCHRFSEILHETGYESCCTTQLGRVRLAAVKLSTLNSQPSTLFLKRLPANEMDTPDLLEAKLCGSYDWLNTPQTMTKHIKSWFKPASTSLRPDVMASVVPTTDL